MKDQAAASNLLEEIETAKLYHPTARQSVSFGSRIDTIMKRLAIRGDPASPVSLFPRPEHSLFPEQKTANDSLARLLSSEIANANQLARKVDLAAKEYRASYEAVKRVETLLQSVKEVSTVLSSIHKKYEEGIMSPEGDGSPPNLHSEKCLEPARHSIFSAFLPSLLEETNLAIDEADACLKAAPMALLGLNIPGIDQSFKENASSDVKALFVLKETVTRTRDDVSERTARLRESRRISSEIDTKLASLITLNSQIFENMGRDRWQQESGGNVAPPTPESPTSPLSTTPDHASFEAQLLEIDAKMARDVDDPLERLSATLESPLQIHLRGRVTELHGSLDHTRGLLRLLGLVREQSAAMNSVRDRFHHIMNHIEDSKIHIAGLTDGVLSSQECFSSDAGASLLDLVPIEQDVSDFLEGLPSWVPFVAKHAPVVTAKRTAVVKPTSPSVFGEFDVHGGLPFDLISLDAAVRTDCNTYSIRLNGNMESLRKEKKRLELAIKAREVDFALLTPSKAVNDLASDVSSEEVSLSNLSVEADEAPEKLQSMLDGISTFSTRRIEVSRSLSPIRQLLQTMDSFFGDLDSTVRDKLFTSRVKAVDGLESEVQGLHDAIKTLEDKISSALHSAKRHQEDLKQAEVQRRMEEEARIAAEEAERLRREQEALEQKERERMEQEKIAESRRQELERERIAMEQAEKERLAAEASEAERLRLEERAKHAEEARFKAEQERLAKLTATSESEEGKG